MCWSFDFVSRSAPFNNDLSCRCSLARNNFILVNKSGFMFGDLVPSMDRSVALRKSLRDSRRFNFDTRGESPDAPRETMERTADHDSLPADAFESAWKAKKDPNSINCIT